MPGPVSWVLPAALTSAVIGSVLSLANQWGQLLHSPYDSGLAARPAANHAVPFGVARTRAGVRSGRAFAATRRWVAMHCVPPFRHTGR